MNTYMYPCAMDTPRVRVIKRLVADYNQRVKDLGQEIIKLAQAHIPIDSSAFSDYYVNVITFEELRGEIAYLRGHEDSDDAKLIENMCASMKIVEEKVVSGQARIKEYRDDTKSKNFSKLQPVFEICDELDYIVNRLIKMNIAS